VLHNTVRLEKSMSRVVINNILEGENNRSVDYRRGFGGERERELLIMSRIQIAREMRSRFP
jgi:hypothetical protein